MSEKRQYYFQLAAWSLSLVVVAIAIVAWGQGFRWHFNRLSNYRLFPLFGLLAFSLMWSHYIVAALRIYLKVPKEVTKQYFEVTSLLVLAAILAHPGILWWQLWRDGFGLPPGSYAEHYVAPGLAWVAALGGISLCVFLAYELRRVFSSRPWWRYVQYASDIAMLVIIYHSLRLGALLQKGWLKEIWFGYAVTLIVALGYIYWDKLQTKHSAVVAKTTPTQG